MEQNSSFDRDRLKNAQTWRRSRSDRVLGGVCGGIGRALNVDPVLIRVVMAVLIVSGPGLFLYPAAWLLMPDEGSSRAPAQNLLGDRVRPDHPWLWPVIVGACVFIAIAMMSSFNVGKLVPGPLIVLALLWLFVFRHKNKSSRLRGRLSPHHQHQPYHSSSAPDQSSPGPYQPGPGPYQPAQAYQAGPSAPPAGPSSSSATQRPQDRTVEPVPPVWTEDDPLGLYAEEPATPTQRPAATPPAKGMRGVKPAVVLLAGLAIAIAWAAGASTPTMLVIGLATLGAGMLLGGFLGRTMALLPLAVLLAAGAAASSVFPSAPKNFADVNHAAPATETVTATSHVYNFDAGGIKLDLTKATFAPGAKITAHGGAGEIVVKLPKDVDVKGEISTDMGEVKGLSVHRGGHGATLALDDLGADGKPGPQEVTVDLDMRFGSITVERG